MDGRLPRWAARRPSSPPAPNVSLLKNKRLAAGWDDSYLEQFLFGQ